MRYTSSLLLLAILTTACSNGQSLYRWGEYEPSLYEMYREDGGSADPSAQLEILTEDVERTEAEGGSVPPGVHAHLAFLYYADGNRSAARKHFMAEKELYPESATFIDALLRRMEKGGR